MKKFLILWFLICMASYSYAQLNRSYIIAPRPLEYTLKFFFGKDGYYAMSLGDMTSWSARVNCYFSIGNYEIKNDSIILTDSYTHHQMLMQLDSPYLKPIITYPFMKDITFKDGFPVSEYWQVNIDKEITIEKKISDFDKTNVQYNHLEEGIYKYGVFGGLRFELQLNSDKTYEFNFKEEEIVYPLNREITWYLIFSTGTWERKGNILTLWDANFQHQFYGLIREDGIELLFFRWDDVVFAKKLY